MASAGFFFGFSASPYSDFHQRRLRSGKLWGFQPEGKNLTWFFNTKPAFDCIMQSFTFFILSVIRQSGFPVSLPFEISLQWV